jgi:hypothetical protein
MLLHRLYRYLKPLRKNREALCTGFLAVRVEPLPSDLNNTRPVLDI